MADAHQHPPDPTHVTQGEEELSEIARSIEAIFAREEHQEIAAEPSGVDAEAEPLVPPEAEADTLDPVVSSEAEVDASDPVLPSESEVDVPDLALSSEAEVDAPERVFASEPEDVEVDAPEPVFASEAEVDTADPVHTSETEIGPSDPALDEPDAVLSSGPEVDAPGADVPFDTELHEPVVREEAHAEAGPPPSEVEQALNEAISEYLQAAFADQDHAANAVRAAVDAAHSVRALDAIASNVDIMLLQAAGDSAVENLASELADADVSARMVIALGRVRDEEQREERIRAYTGLGAAFAKAIADVLTETEDRLGRKTYIAALGAFGDIGAQAVGGMIQDDRWFVVRNGVAVLGVVGEASAVEALTETLAHEHPGVRRETVLSLARIGGENAGLLVSSMLGDSDPEVRSAAARAVSTLKVEKAYKTLMEILKKGDEESVTEEVLRALGALGDASAVPAIAKQVSGSFLSRPPTGVRIAGLTALAAIGTPHAVSLVEKARKDTDQEVKAAAEQLLTGR